MGGVFPKLGIEAHFAESYNAKAKVIERFFRTFQEQFERFITNVDKQIRPNWHFDPQAVLALINLIEQGSYSSIRSIAEAFGRSRQWVFVYLEALASAGVICVNHYGYCVLTKKDIGKVGIKIKRGILKDLLSHCAELRKEQKLQEKLDAWHLKLEGPEPLEKEMEVFDIVNKAVMMHISKDNPINVK